VENADNGGTHTGTETGINYRGEKGCETGNNGDNGYGNNNKTIISI
jgi:hypothetical protein